MTEFRSVTSDFSVSPQISAADVATARDLGVELIINNRPDGETSDQPPGAEIEAAVRAGGLDYVHIPVRGGPTPEQVEALRAAAAGVKTLAFCRSGTRSIITWCLGELAAGSRSRHELLRLAATAGYDLSDILPS